MAAAGFCRQSADGFDYLDDDLGEVAGVGEDGGRGHGGGGDDLRCGGDGFGVHGRLSLLCGVLTGQAGGWMCSCCHGYSCVGSVCLSSCWGDLVGGIQCGAGRFFGCLALEECISLKVTMVAMAVAMRGVPGPRPRWVAW